MGAYHAAIGAELKLDALNISDGIGALDPRIIGLAAGALCHHEALLVADCCTMPARRH